MGSIEPAPRPVSSPTIYLGWVIAAAAIGAGVYFWLDRSEETSVYETPTDRSVAADQLGVSTATGARNESWAKNRQIGELELRLKIAEQENAASEIELVELRSEVEALRASEQKHRQGLDAAVDELNQLKEQLGRAEQQSARRSSLESILPTTKVGPLGN